jgi:hypothetical protein
MGEGGVIPHFLKGEQELLLREGSLIGVLLLEFESYSKH